jgi:hypothetical protein
MTEHWTDKATDRPIFTTVIPARGAEGNVFLIVGSACRLLREIGIPSDRIEALCKNAMASKSYEEAVGFVEHWFRVDRDRDDSEDLVGTGR